MRFKPKKLGKMLAEHLSVVRPLEVFFSEKFNCKGGVDLKEFTWADYRKGVWDCDFLSDRLRMYTSEHMMHGLGFQEYRQVATVFMQKHLKYQVNKSTSISNSLDVQAGHSSRTAGMEYSISMEDHRRVSRESMHKFYLVSKEWQRLLLRQASETTNEMRQCVCIQTVQSQTQTNARCPVLADSSQSSPLIDPPISNDRLNRSFACPSTMVADIEIRMRCIELESSCYIRQNSGMILRPRMAQMELVGVDHSVTSEFQLFFIHLECAQKFARIVIDECC
jgi:hypothetical protein